MFYKNCLAEMRTKFHIEKDPGTEADAEGDDGLFIKSFCDYWFCELQSMHIEQLTERDMNLMSW